MSGPIMLNLAAVVLLAATILLAVPVAVVALQTACAWPRHRARAETGPRPTLAVLMPAHDEAGGIGAAIAAVLAELQPGDRLLVVADNCSDTTAAVAAAAGAEVTERHDAQRRGKGYALDHGVRVLEASPPAVVVIVDADCRVHPGALDRLARQSLRTGRPAQALYLMDAPPGAGLKTRIARFAWVLKNRVRPLGFWRLGLPCPLMGTGMAFPWEVIRTAPLASGHIVEDMQLGLTLALQGRPPRFCPDALVTSSFPANDEGTTAQRTRWEHGHLGVIASQALPMLGAAAARFSPPLLLMALDLCVPPLAALVLLLVGATVLDAALFAIGGPAPPLQVALAAFAVFAAAVAAAWWRHGREVITLRELLGIPGYVLGKFSIYRRLFGARQVEWVRTKRDEGPK